MVANTIKTQQRPLWELNGWWLFGLSVDGTLLFYPQGWGRAFVVPTGTKREEIEEFLTLWLMRLRWAIRASRPVGLLAVVVLLATFLPPFCRMVWYIPGWHILFQSALLVAALGCLLVVASPLVLRFAAQIAKAELEKAKIRRPLVRFFRDYALRSCRRRLWFEELCYSAVLLEGIWLLWPRRGTIMLPASVDPRLLPVGVVLTVLGGIMAFIKLCQIRVKVQYR